MSNEGQVANKSAQPPHSFDACLELSRVHFQHFDTRRAYEWKISLALWALVLVVTKGIVELREWPHYQAVAALVLPAYSIVLLVYVIWSWRMYIANKYDKDRANTYLDLARGMLPDSLRSQVLDTEKQKAHRRMRGDPRPWDLLLAWNHFTQLIVTAALMAGSWWTCSLTITSKG